MAKVAISVVSWGIRQTNLRAFGDGI
jgi:hypothetical protein